MGNQRKKKKLTAAVASVTALALLLGGTFAWQSISQTALNEKEEIINPGGRLHNDQNWISDKKNDTNIYVENFTDSENGGNDIYARVRLEEYMEIVMNYGTPAETVTKVTGSKTLKAGSEYNGNATEQNEFDYTYSVHKFGADNATDDWWTWTEGNKESEDTYYIPTFNKNKDSLLADLNGVFDATVGGFSSSTGTDKYTYEEVTSARSKKQYAVYDGDSNTGDEVDRETLLDLLVNGESSTSYAAVSENVKVVEETHNAAKVGNSNGLISISDWLALEENTGDYWVYDEDGWVYWSSPIKAGTATGLLLDSIELNKVMDDTYYYAINVTGQFITADDLGKDDDTGFYANGETVSDKALDLLEKIGVDTGKDTEKDEENKQADKIYAMFTNSEETSGAYDLIYFTAAENLSDEEKATAAGVSTDKVALCVTLTDTAEGQNSGYSMYGKSWDYIYNTATVKFANKVKPTCMRNYFGGIGTNLSSPTVFDWTNLDTSAVTSIENAFGGNIGTTDLSVIDTSHVTNMKSAFSGCRSESLDLSGWDFSNVTTMETMFQYSHMKNITFGEDCDTSKVTTIKSMFSDCGSLENVDLSGVHVENVTDMSRMFANDKLLKTVTLGESWNTAKVTDMERMFSYCNNLTLDCSSWNVESVTNHADFRDCGFQDIKTITEPMWQN